jgi:prepilin-type processing-associated H-X9-DG protein
LVVTQWRGNVEPLILVAAKNKVETKLLLAKLVPGGEAKKYNGKDYFATDRKAAVILGEKSYAVGYLADVQAILDGGKSEGGLAPALKLAAGKYAAVVGINPAAFADLEGDLPADAEPFKPLLKASLGTLTIDLADKVQAKLKVEFPAAAEATAGTKALEMTRDLTLKLLGGNAKMLAKDKTAAPLVEMLGQLEKSLKSAELKRDGSAVIASVEMKTPLAGIGAIAADMVGRVRQAAQRAQSANNLKQIGLAMHNYLDTSGTFPPQALFDKDGKASLSWRVLLLPYLDQDALYKEFKLDESWDSPHNKKLLAKIPRVFKDTTGKAKNAHGTFLQVFVGKGAAFEGKVGARIADFTDGTSNTILAIETEKEVPWTKPDDVPFDAAKELPKLGGLFTNGFNALFADGSVRFISSSVSKTTMKAVITRSGGEVIGSDF